MKKILLISILFSFHTINSFAQEEKYIGLFIYNFTKYFEWPEPQPNNFVIQILGHKSVYDELSKIAVGKKVGNQNIVIKHLTTPEEIDPTAQILFLGHWQTRLIDQVNSIIAGKSILLVSEFDGLLDKGASINFVVREGSIKFELNKKTASSAGLKTDPRLTQLAYRVVE